ncbi:MAG: AAA family ATPase [Bacteroidia bacterium]|nr:AAA family ATPase [Bacteroidia bacterium]
MTTLTVEELVGLLSRKELLQVAREGREVGLFRPTYPLNHYDTAGLRRILRRHIERLARLPSVQELLQRYSRRGKERLSPFPAPQLPPLSVLIEQLFPEVWGMEVEKENLVEWIYLPLAAPKEASRYGVSSSPSLLVEGAPGNGKSYLIRRFARASGFAHRIIHTPALANKWYGETERRLRAVIQHALRKSPSLLIFEEIDAIFPDREKNLEWLNGPTLQFLLLLDEIKERGGVAVIGITNRAQRLEPALIRHGRFDRRLYIPPPDYTERLLFLTHMSRPLPCSPDIRWEEWAEVTAGYTRADLTHLLQEAGFRAFLRHCRDGTPQLITEEDLHCALRSG